MRVIILSLLVFSTLLVSLFVHAEVAPQKIELLNYSKALPPTISTNNGIYYKNLNVRHGLNSNQIKCVLEDHEGNIWLGSLGGGLFRYDGHKFAHFQKKSGMDRFIRALYQDSKNNIWVGTQNGVYCYDGVEIKHYTEKDGLQSGFIMSISEDENGHIWVGSWRNNYQMLGDSGFIRNDLNRSGSFASLVDRKNRFWLCTNEGLCIKNKSNQFIELNNGDIKDFSIRFSGICEDNNGWIWAIGNSNRIFKINPDNLHVEEFEQSKKVDDVFQWIKSDRRGNLYIGSRKSGLLVINIKTNKQKYIFEGFEFNDALADDYHTIWLADKSHGLIWMPESPFENFDIGTNRGAFGLVMDYDNKLFFGSFREKFKTMTNGVIKEWDSEINQVNRKFSTSLYFSKDEQYIGTNFGLIRLKKGKEQLNDQVKHIRCIKRIGDNLLVGTEIGLDIFNVPSQKWLNIGDFIKKELDVYVVDIAIENDSSWWLATDIHGIMHFENGVLKEHLTTRDGLCHNHTKSICFDGNGNVWVGTNDGLSVYFKGDFINFSSDDGLSHDLIQTVILDNTGNIWVGTERGINRLEFIDGKLDVKVYGINEGFLGNDCAQNSVYIEPNNTIWWGTGSKITKYSPLLDQEDLIPPTVRIDELLIHYKDVHWHKTENNLQGIQYSGISKWSNLPTDLELNYDKNHITFKFLSIDWKTPDKLIYQYKLEGFQKNWSIPDKHPDVTYSNLPAGEYTFLVKSRNDDGYWSASESFDFKVHPPWWKTIIARVLFSILILLLLISYINLRTKNLKAKQKHLEKIVRQRTAEIELQKDEIEKQKLLVDIKNKEITDSVRYARRIQRALLEPEEHVNRLMPEHFIFFKPRNIVSGDFYWSSLQNETIYVCAADCTGHGVPGAMLSMLGISFLNQIVSGNSKIQPNEVLSELRKNMIKELSQKGLEEDSKDGIDGGIIRLEGKQLSYAGANNALYIIRSNDLAPPPIVIKTIVSDEKTLFEIRGDKQPIGYHPNKSGAFTNISFEVFKGDLIFLLSDGFPDQFGGDKGKKLKYAPFKNFLLGISSSSIKVQKELVENKFSTWKGSYEQVDDILVIGMRIG